MSNSSYVAWFSEVGRDDIASVGGKNASLGELVCHLGDVGIAVPDGFALTSQAYDDFLDSNGLRDYITHQMKMLQNGAELAKIGQSIRGRILQARLPDTVASALLAAYHELGKRIGTDSPAVAVRSSATAEDLPEASFAGQQETFLNVAGEPDMMNACRRCFASVFTDRAINYRLDMGIDHLQVSLSVGVQRMVRSDVGGAGVMFTLDTESGFPDTILINAAWGLGETVVQGAVDPDEHVIFKPLLDRLDLRPIIGTTLGRKQIKVVYRNPTKGSGTTTVDTSENERATFVLSQEEVLVLSRWAVLIEDHYGTPMDIEWAKDGITGELFIVQARPETVQTRRDTTMLRSFQLQEKGTILATGLAVGDGIASGPVCRLESPQEIDRFVDASVLVTEMTDPDWEPIMKRAAAIVTRHGGRTSHAAIVSRELGVPAIVGASEIDVLADSQRVTVSCAEGDEGRVYAGGLMFTHHDVDLGTLPETRTKIMLNLGNPAAAMRWWRLPADGVGLARIEFVVNNHIKVHPMALINSEKLDDQTQRKITELTRGHASPVQYFVNRLADGIAHIAASRWPRPVIVRFSDFKTNEYAKLIGGAGFEPDEQNPMLGWRGASRYYSPGYRQGFELECRAVKRVRDEIGLTNLIVMVPFCRTLAEADQVLNVMATQGLSRGSNQLRVFVMAEVPSNVVLADEFADRFDGFSIGTNDLTQLTLGVDRDSAELASLFDETDPAVTASIASLVAAAHRKNRPIGLCGQRPSDDPSFARFLVSAGIDSISVTPDSFITVKTAVAAAEQELSLFVATIA